MRNKYTLALHPTKVMKYNGRAVETFFEASIKIVFWKSFVSKVATLPERNNTGFSGDHNDQPYFLYNV
jgi:hypothetical protein